MPSMQELKKHLKNLNEYGRNWNTGRYLTSAKSIANVRNEIELEILALEKAELLRERQEQEILRKEKRKEEIIKDISHDLDIQDCLLECQDQIKDLTKKVKEIEQTNVVHVHNYHNHVHRHTHNYLGFTANTFELVTFHKIKTEKRLELFNKNRGLDRP